MPPLTSFALLNFINERHPIHLLLSAGTRIVTRNESNRIGGGPVIPAGSVAVILDAPADAQHAYKIHTNDRSEAMLRRTEFSILKEFKNDEAIGRESSADLDFEDKKPFTVLYIMSQFKTRHAPRASFEKATCACVWTNNAKSPGNA